MEAAVSVARCSSWFHAPGVLWFCGLPGPPGLGRGGRSGGEGRERVVGEACLPRLGE